MNDRPLMPKATAVWLVENTKISFKQIADFCNLHELEVKGIADGDVEKGIKAYNPILAGQLTREEIEECSKNINKPLVLNKKILDIKSEKKVNRYIPLSKDKIDVLVIGHGSMDPNAGISINYIVDELRKSYKNVDRCYLEIEEPNIEQGIQSCQNNNPDVLVIVFYFLHEGAHVKTDINNDLKPALEKSNLKKVCVTKHLGADEKMIDLIVERAKEVENAN